MPPRRQEGRLPSPLPHSGSQHQDKARQRESIHQPAVKKAQSSGPDSIGEHQVL